MALSSAVVFSLGHTLAAELSPVESHRSQQQQQKPLPLDAFSSSHRCHRSWWQGRFAHFYAAVEAPHAYTQDRPAFCDRTRAPDDLKLDVGFSEMRMYVEEQIAGF